ncbi:MAG: ferritin [bacterium]|nr:ferritin [bacterium]
MINKKIEEAINKQINAELYSAYLYLSMGAYFGAMNLPGFENWMKVQAQEETFHAMKFFNFVNERGGRVILEAIDKPEVEWDNPVAVFEEVYKHEQHVTDLINKLMDLAIKENDHATRVFLTWYIDEQVEEEANASSLLEKLKMIGDSKNGVFMMDHGLSKRVFKMPAKEED